MVEEFCRRWDGNAFSRPVLMDGEVVVQFDVLLDDTRSHDAVAALLERMRVHADVAARHAASVVEAGMDVRFAVNMARHEIDGFERGAA